MADITGQVTGLIPTVLAVGILKKTSDTFLGKQASFRGKVKLFKK